MARRTRTDEARWTEMALQCVFQGGWLDVQDMSQLEGTSKALKARAETWWEELDQVDVDNTSTETLKAVKTIVKKCRNLKKISLNRVAHLQETYIQQCVQPKVQSLTITRSRRLTGETLHAMLRNLEHLELLDVSGCIKIMHMDLEKCLELPALRRLKVLRVVDLPINTWTMSHLPILCPDLVELDAGCSSFKQLVWEDGSRRDVSLQERREKIVEKLGNLNLARNNGVNTKVDDGERTWNVEKLLLSNRGMYEEDLIHGYPRCPNLIELDLSYNDLCDNVVVEIARHCRKLKVLKLSASLGFQKRLRDESLLVISQNLPELMELHLHQQEHLTGHGLQDLAALQNLRKVIISRNHQITTKSVLSMIRDSRPDFTLTLVRCKRVSTKINNHQIIIQ
eukprot:scaffold285_cov330-Pavlova_lutheri.AAC.56